MLNLKSIKFTIFFILLLILFGCANEPISTNNPPNSPAFIDLKVPHITLNPSDSDADNDFIPDAIERLQKKDPLNPDENENGIVDGLEGDKFFSYQWYIYSSSAKVICNTANIKTIKGNDLNITSLYHYTLGNNSGTQTIQVVDGGVDRHPDIDLDIDSSINSINHTNDPTPTEGFSNNPIQIFYRGHGTAVAGIIGAKGFNGIGIRGIAPTVKIAGSNWLESEDISLLDEVWSSDNNISISNNSWGTKFIDDFSYETIMQKASKLRDGKGRIFVFAGGNEREDFSNANLSYLINNPYVIAVSAINHKDKYASYSTAGSNILVSAYGGEHYYTAPTILTTFTPHKSMLESELIDKKGPITIDEDTNRSYTYAMNGSSAAAPMVSGALALVLDMCPDLSWRDIRWLIALTSTKIDKEDKNWIKNRASLSHNNSYGFGKINPLAMVEICLSPDYKYLPKQSIISLEDIKYSTTIPDNNQTIEKRVTIERDIQIDWVGLSVTIDHKFAGDIEIDLVSPSGTISHIISTNFLNFNAYQNGFRFATVSLMGERSKGIWRVQIRDALKDDIGILENIKLEIRGYEL